MVIAIDQVMNGDNLVVHGDLPSFNIILGHAIQRNCSFPFVYENRNSRPEIYLQNDTSIRAGTCRLFSIDAHVRSEKKQLDR